MKLPDWMRRTYYGNSKHYRKDGRYRLVKKRDRIVFMVWSCGCWDEILSTCEHLRKYLVDKKQYYQEDL